jgi:hypothetical protein
LKYAINSEGTGITKTNGKTITGNTGTGFKASDYGTGLYIFERTKEDTELSEYAGYYYLAGASGADGTYYALDSIAANTADGVTTFTVTYQIKEAVDPADTTWALADDEQSIQVTYAGADADDTTDDIVINIKLAEDYDQYWTLITDGTDYTFYYKKLLASAKTSEDIVAAVELDKDVTEDAYYELEYNLTVNSESVQVTADSAGNQTTTSVEGWNATATATMDTTDSSKIASVAWTAKASSNTTTPSSETPSTNQ